MEHIIIISEVIIGILSNLFIFLAINILKCSFLSTFNNIRIIIKNIKNVQLLFTKNVHKLKISTAIMMKHISNPSINKFFIL